MSRDPMPMDWDDARIAAAFRARFEVEPATSLAALIVAALPRRQRQRWALPRRSSFAFAAAAFALVLVLVGVQTGVLPWLPQSTSPAPAPSRSPSASPSVTARPSSTPEPFPTQVTVNATGATLPVVSVSDAITVRDGGVNSEELAVGGWYEFNVVPCPLTHGELTPLEDCVLDFAWLMAAPEQLATTDPTGAGAFRGPAGPAIHPVLLGRAVQFMLGAYPDPVHVVFVGHFDDPLAARCGRSNQQHCADQFMVDELGWPSGPIARTVPGKVADLPVQSVADAMNAHDGQERAVAGWYQGSFQPLNCPRTWTYVVLDGCTAPYQYLMQDPEAILVGTEGIRAPSGPGFGLTFDGFDKNPMNPGIQGPDGPSLPTQVIVIGHFMDRRVQLCPTEVRASCAHQFIVDAIGWDSGQTRKVPWDFDLRDGPNPPAAATQIQVEQGFVATQLGYAILNTVKMPGDRAFELEPGITDAPGIDLSGMVWFIHAYSHGTPSVETPAIFAIDAQGTVYTDGGGGWGRGG
jgi:hypothetical protein